MTFNMKEGHFDATVAAEVVCHKTMKEAWERMKVADSAAKGAAKSRHVLKKL